MFKDNEIVTVTCIRPVRGNYVFLRLNRKGIMTLCEVLVFEYQDTRKLKLECLDYLR